jgi:hypothetical protein
MRLGLKKLRAFFYSRDMAVRSEHAGRVRFEGLRDATPDAGRQTSSAG